MGRKTRSAIVKRDARESRDTGHRYDYAGTGVAHWSFDPPAPGAEFNTRYGGVIHPYNPEG